MGRRGIRGLKARVWRECSIRRGQATLNSGSIQARGIRGGSHSVTMRCNGGSNSGGSHRVTSRDTAGEQFQE